MPFRASFACLWCGADHVTRSPDDLEGWAQLCPTCLGKAGDNNFLRVRLRQALTERGAAAGEHVAPKVASGPTATEASPVAMSPGADVRPDEEAIAADDDDWYRRRGRHAHGAIHDAVWDAELDMAGRWLDGIPFAGDIVELDAGVGWWSPLLASKGELWSYDTSPIALDRARDRLVAHGLRAHLHLRSAGAEPDRQVGGLFAPFVLSQVDREGLPGFLELVGRWLIPGGRFAFIESLPNAGFGALDHPSAGVDRESSGLSDRRGSRTARVPRRPDAYVTALQAAGFRDIDVSGTGRFFILGSAVT